MNTQPAHPGERLFLLDGMALAYRAYYSFISRPLLNSRGENTSAIYGFTTTLVKILDEEKPDHVAVVFDTKEPTFRHTMFPEYKATRQKMPEDMALQLDQLKEVVRAFRTPSIELPGFEADDIIGTLARRAEKEGIQTFLVTADKDFMQLVSPLIKLYKPGKGGSEIEIVAEEGVREKFGVTPNHVVDVLALTGDKSDNVPGVPGIGEKTAIPLIQQYGDLENLYSHLEEIAQKGTREKLLAHREKAFLSRRLVTIDTQVPLKVDLHELRSAQWDVQTLGALFARLEFKSLLARITQAATAAPPAGPPAEIHIPQTTDITTDAHRYVTVVTLRQLDDLCVHLEGARTLVFDTETTSTDAMSATLIGVSFSPQEREAYYVPIRPGRSVTAGENLFREGNPGTGDSTVAGLDLEEVLRRIRPVLESPSIRKVGQNLKYDMLVLRRHGIVVQGVSHDTMVASYILRPDGQHNLDALAMEALSYRMISFEDLVGKGKNQKPITQVPVDRISDYSAEDADMTMRIYRWQLPRMEQLGLLHLCETVEFPLISVLTEMEFAGVALDVSYLAEMSRDLDKQLDALIHDIHRLAGETFNINSTQQLAEILFRKLGLAPQRRTKTGFSTDVGVLEALSGQHPIIEKLLEYRQLNKLKSTYVDALPSLLNAQTGRLHTSFNQTVAATGRLSSSDPNLQNIPIRTAIGKAIRKAFVPGGRGNILLSADYSQIELRVMAHMSGDEGLRQAFLHDEDIHATTAEKVFGVARAEVTPDMRRKAKEVNFGIMYGIGPFGLANRLEITQNEAREIIRRYFDRFPKVKQYISDTIETARTSGYVSTTLGRRRYLPDINSRNQNTRGNAERQAINMPIQGTAADMIKLAMIQVAREITARKLRSMMILQVHDELVFEVPETEQQVMESLVVEKMRNALPLSVPLKVQVGTGRNWLEAH